MEYSTVILRGTIGGAILGMMTTALFAKKITSSVHKYPAAPTVSENSTMVALLSNFSHWQQSSVTGPVMVELLATLETYLQLLTEKGHAVKFKAHRHLMHVEILLKNIKAHAKGLGTQNTHEDIESDSEAVMKYLNDLMHNYLLD